ncbi:MAG: hypothetical protein HY736_06820 [Verrucomicrobia bacterium]|nr:hypothetical protein [Verrucomicrobiota bacterium]
MTPDTPGILYCNCTYAQIIDPAVKGHVLRRLCDSGKSFEAVADLCEMSARKDPALKRLAGGPGVKIAACYPRAVKWLFASAGAPLDGARTEVLNMREQAGPAVIERLLADDVQPNLPPGKASPGVAPRGQTPEPEAQTGATSAEAPASA